MWNLKKIAASGLTYSHLSRYREIISVLFKYGFTDLVDLFFFDKALGRGLKRIFARRKSGAGPAEGLSGFSRIRLAMEELGPTFIKLGQALSMRPDFVPVELMDELARLQDNVPPSPYDEIKKIIESELGRPVEAVFESFEKDPLASASIGQVHKARLKDGREVAVKVRRPGIASMIAVDIGILYHLALKAQQHIEEFAFIKPTKIVEEFARTIARELDFRIEAAHMERFAANFKDDSHIHIPEVIHELTGKQVLCMEFIYGVKVSDMDELDRLGIDKKLITKRGADIVLKQIFDHGFFHSDPHSGNIFVLPNGVIVMLDFGQVGMVDQQTKEDFVDLIDSVVHENPMLATRQLLRITLWDKRPDTRLLEKDVADFMARHLYKTLKDLNIAELVQDLLEMVSRHRLRIPPDIFLMMKALATIEGIARRLDPDFDMIAQAEPFISQVKLGRLAPHRVAEETLAFSAEAIRFIKHFPTDMLELSKLIREQKLYLSLSSDSIDKIISSQYKLGKRISLSIICAALFIASPIMIASNTPPVIGGSSFPGIAGLAVAGFLGVFLVISAFRK